MNRNQEDLLTVLARYWGLAVEDECHGLTNRAGKIYWKFSSKTFMTRYLVLFRMLK